MRAFVDIDGIGRLEFREHWIEFTPLDPGGYFLDTRLVTHWQHKHAAELAYAIIDAIHGTGA